VIEYEEIRRRPTSSRSGSLQHGAVARTTGAADLPDVLRICTHASGMHTKGEREEGVKEMEQGRGEAMGGDRSAQGHIWRGRADTHHHCQACTNGGTHARACLRASAQMRARALERDRL
jgi:hypothetical protein